MMKTSAELAALIAALTFLTVAPAFADKADQQTGIGMGRGIATVEKCTGIPPSNEYLRAIYTFMVDKQGANGEDFKSGFVAGAMQASVMFPGKPPATECRQAALLKSKLDKELLR